MHSCRAKFSAADDFHSDRLEENFVRGACLVMFVPYRWSTCCLPPPLRSSVDGLDQKNGYRESDVETIRRS